MFINEFLVSGVPLSTLKSELELSERLLKFQGNARASH